MVFPMFIPPSRGESKSTSASDVIGFFVAFLLLGLVLLGIGWFMGPDKASHQDFNFFDIMGAIVIGGNIAIAFVFVVFLAVAGLIDKIGGR